MGKLNVRHTKAQREFLDALHNSCDGVSEFRAIPGGNQIFSNDPHELREFMVEHKHRNLFVGIATRKDSSSGKLKNCHHLGTVFIDLDFKDVPEEEARKRIKMSPLLPSIIIHSGHGLHVYWLLKEPLDLQDAQDVTVARQLLRRLARYFQADMNSAEPARILRLPDTFNYKYAPPREVTLEFLDANRQYDPIDFDEWLPDEEPAINDTSSSHERTIPQGERNTTLHREGRKLHATGLPEDEIQRVLHRINREQCIPPLPDAEVDQIAHKAATQTDRPDFTPDSPAVSSSGFNPIAAVDFLNLDTEEEPISYVWEGLLPTGSVAALTAHPKCGKTTLSYHLAAAVTTGSQFLGRQIKQRNVLIIACEEHQNIIKHRLRSLHHDPVQLFIHTGFLETKTSFYEALKEYLIAHRISLVLIDTLGSFWDVEDENIATKVTKALKPIVHLARTTDTCFLLLHHNRKSGGSAGSEIRGSSAIFAAVDVSLIMKENSVRTERTITVKSRYPNAPEKMLIELRDGKYSDLSCSQDAKQGQKDKIFSHMTEEFTSIKEIADGVELHYTTVSGLLKQMMEERKIRKKPGTGRGGQVLYAKKRPRLRLVLGG